MNSERNEMPRQKRSREKVSCPYRRNLSQPLRPHYVYIYRLLSFLFLFSYYRLSLRIEVSIGVANAVTKLRYATIAIIETARTRSSINRIIHEKYQLYFLYIHPPFLFFILKILVPRARFFELSFLSLPRIKGRNTRAPTYPLSHSFISAR